MSLTELIEGFGKQTLKPTTTVVKHLPVDVEQLEKVNPALARFYMENLMPPPAPAAVSFVIANTFKALPPKSTSTASDLTYYDWTLSVNFLDATQLKYIDSVVFDLHPTFSPPSIHMSARSASQQQAASSSSSSSSSSSASPADSGCFSLRRKGWGVFKIGITICDIFGKTYPFTHRLTFSNPDNAHEEQIQIALPAPSFSSSATSSSSAPSSSATSSSSASSSATSSSATSSSAPSSSATSSSSPSSSPSSSSPSSSSAGFPSAVPIRRMTGVEEGSMHGALGVGKGWAAPYLVTFCDEEARPGYRSMKAHEYNEDPVTLRQKVRVLASLLKRAKHCVTYTGAGISTASGIDDYASKAKDSLATGTGAIGARPKRKTGLDAEPTFAHYVLAALHRAGMVKHWVQQNHDGLPQKAGFPQEAINEIHGAWFDPSNPVVPMEGSLRGDLFSWLRREEQAADLVLTMGTSLCGMNADRMVSTAGKKALHKKQGLGSVIIGFQQTQLDHLASLRIFAKIDEVMLLLAWELQLEVPVQLYTPDIPPAAIVRPHVYRVPYDSQGRLATDGKTTTLWDLSVGAPLMLTDGPGKGFRGVVARTPASATAHYSVQFPCTREGKHLGQGLSLYAFGSWWIEACTKGKVDVLPVINVPRST